MKIQRIEIGQSPVTTEQLRGYIGLGFGCRDTELQMAIDTAIDRIEDHCDVALRTTTFRASVVGLRSVRLPYCSANFPTVNSPENVSVNGADVELANEESTAIIYTVEAVADITSYIAGILAYAALIFDGENDPSAFTLVLRRYLNTNILL